jgi:hypothetical protein
MKAFDIVNMQRCPKCMFYDMKSYKCIPYGNQPFDEPCTESEWKFCIHNPNKLALSIIKMKGNEQENQTSGL